MTEACQLTPRHPLVYYGTFFGPACLILLINTVVFFLVLRVIMLQGQRGRAAGKVAGQGTGYTPTDRRVTMAQVKKNSVFKKKSIGSKST